MDRDPIGLLKRWEDTRARDAEADERNGWKWKKQISLYRNPEFFCPRCETWDETGLTWLVDGARYQLLGVWHMNGKSAYSSFSHIHPHVSGSNICRGDASSAEAALFASIHPDNPYHDINTWLKQIGHAEKCSAFPKLECPLCNQERATVYLVTFGSSNLRVCEDTCYQKALSNRCHRCCAERDPANEERKGPFCEDCFGHLAKPCGICSELWTQDRTFRFKEARICGVCRDTKKKRCAGCSKWFLIRDMDQQGRCSLKCKKVHCNYCGGLTTVGERDLRGYCVECQEIGSKPCSRCGKSMTGSPKGYCIDCTYNCGCDCGCGEEVPEEGILCNACEEGDHA